jgi:tRNA-specific 2-thiouridylase
MYVLAKKIADNALVVGTREQLGRSEVMARDVNWLAGAPPPEPTRVTAKIRYKARPATAEVTPLDDNRALVHFEDFVYGATAGQGVTFYDGKVCLGGGLIADSATIATAETPPTMVEESAR